MDGILEALAFALLIGGQFLAVIVISRSKVTDADPEERMQGTAGPDRALKFARIDCSDPLPLAGERPISQGEALGNFSDSILRGVVRRTQLHARGQAVQCLATIAE